MDREKDPVQSFPDQQLAQALLSTLSQFLSVQEAIDIFEQFQSDQWIPNGQVLWSGVPRDRAQEWADNHHLQTLTTAMGPLMDEKHPDCLRLKKTSRQWSRYIHGASAIFAWHIAQGEMVTLLSPPPHERFHPSGLSYYQVIEEPIIKGLFSRCAVDKIIIAHPTIHNSQDFLYELWPADKVNEWLQRYGSRSFETNWRQTGRNMNKLRSEMLMTVPEQYIQSKAYKVALIKPTRIQLLVVIILILLDKLPLLLLVGLLYSLADNIWDENKTNNHRIPQQAEQARVVEGQGAASQEFKDEKEFQAKAQEEARKKLKDKKKAEAKAQEESKKKLKDKKKAGAKAQEEARKKLKDKKKAEAKAQEESKKKLKDKKKAEAKAQEEARKKLKDKKKAEAKAQEESKKKLKDKKKAEAKAQEEAKKKLKDKKKAEAKAKEEARKKLKDKKKAEAKAQEEARKKLKDKKKAEAKAQEEARKKLKDKKKADAKAQEEAKKRLKDKKKAEAKAKEDARKKFKDNKKG